MMQYLIYLWTKRTMVPVSDGDSDIGAQVCSEIGNLIFFRHLLSKFDFFLYMCSVSLRYVFCVIF